MLNERTLRPSAQDVPIDIASLFAHFATSAAATAASLPETRQAFFAKPAMSLGPRDGRAHAKPPGGDSSC
jgi:hypothetical protein